MFEQLTLLRPAPAGTAPSTSGPVDLDRDVQPTAQEPVSLGADALRLGRGRLSGDSPQFLWDVRQDVGE